MQTAEKTQACSVCVHASKQPACLSVPHHVLDAPKSWIKLWRVMRSHEGLPTGAAYPTRDDEGRLLTTEFGLCLYKDHQVVTLQACPQHTSTCTIQRETQLSWTLRENVQFAPAHIDNRRAMHVITQAAWKWAVAAVVAVFDLLNCTTLSVHAGAAGDGAAGAAAAQHGGDCRGGPSRRLQAGRPREPGGRLPRSTAARRRLRQRRVPLATGRVQRAAARARQRCVPYGF